MTAPLWIGAYTADADGRAAGISLLGADEWHARSALVSRTESPSFIATHPTLPLLYAVHEMAGTVSAFAIGPDFALTASGEHWSAGLAACHVAVDPQGHYLSVACWGDGQVIAYELDQLGAITSRLPASPSVDPYAQGRQSRAHASLVLHDRRIMTTDLGHDLLRVWSFTSGIGFGVDHEVPLPLGTGPRHLVQHSDGRVFVVTELTSEVAIVDGTGIDCSVLALVPATAEAVTDTDTAAEIALSTDESRLYVGIRGSNRISTLSVAAKQVRAIADVDCGGRLPRHHLLHDGQLYVANTDSDEISVLSLHPETGVPNGVIDRIETPSPTVLAAAQT